MKIKPKYLIILLMLIGAFLRFYNLNWGSPFYFHPDERNIANSVAQLSFPDQMNPNFFAYGALPIYAIYFAGVFKNLFTNIQSLLSVSFADAIIISRFYSSLFSMLLIPLLYLLGKNLKDKKVGLLAAFLGTFSTGFIQFAHFGTFEMWLTFFGTVLFWLSLNYLKKPNIKTVILMGLAYGVLISTKVSSLALLPLPIGAMLYHRRNRGLMKIFKNFLLFIIVSAGVFIFSNPFTLLDFQSFLSSMKYESSLATGALAVFYAGGFYNTTPIIYHFGKVFPFLINPIMTTLFILSFFYLSYKGIKTKNHSFLILNSFFLILFISQAFLFVKWVRYMVPTLPFMYLIISVSLVGFLSWIDKNKRVVSIKYLVFSIILTSSIIFSLSYFTTAFVKPDTRIEAAEFLKVNFPSNSRIITEPYDLGIMPFSNISSSIDHFNFYDLDSDRPALEAELETKLSQSEYIVLPSQRLLRSRLLNENRFPDGNDFYSDLLNGSLDFEKIYETPCDIFCQIVYLGDSVFYLEETATVFDRPTIFIFKKIR